MKNLEHLSNEELLNKYHKCWNPSWELEEKRNKLKAEVLRRLNEPWRRPKSRVELIEDWNDKRTALYKIWIEALDKAYKKKLMPIFREHYELLIKNQKSAVTPETRKKLKEIEEMYEE